MPKHPTVSTAPIKIIPDSVRDVLRYDPVTGSLHWLIASTNGKCAPGTIAGSLDRQGYGRVKVGGVHYASHRLAWFLHYGEQPPDLIDHIDRSRSNNRIANLRAATVSQNSRNSNHRSGSQLQLGQGYRAVGDKFRAHIHHSGRRTELGTFRTEGEVIAAHQGAAVLLAAIAPEALPVSLKRAA